MQHLADSFALAPDVQAQLGRLIASCGEFQHLERARLPVVVSQRALVDRGRLVPVMVLHGATFEGTNSNTRNFNAFLRAMFFEPLLERHDAEFIILIDAALWPGPVVEQEQLLYHACCHIEQRTDQYGCPKFGDDGRASLRLRPHDIERFTAEVERFGSVVPGFSLEADAYARACARAARSRFKVAG